MNSQQKLDLELFPERDQRKTEEKIMGSKVDNKKAIVVLFLITLGLSLFFYFKRALPRIWQEVTSPDKIIIEKESKD